METKIQPEKDMEIKHPNPSFITARVYGRQDREAGGLQSLTVAVAIVA